MNKSVLAFKPKLLIIQRIKAPHILMAGEFLEKTFLENNLRLCITNAFKKKEISQFDPIVYNCSSA